MNWSGSATASSPCIFGSDVAALELTQAFATGPATVSVEVEGKRWVVAKLHAKKMGARLRLMLDDGAKICVEGSGKVNFLGHMLPINFDGSDDEDDMEGVPMDAEPMTFPLVEDNSDVEIPSDAEEEEEAEDDEEASDAEEEEASDDEDDEEEASEAEEEVIPASKEEEVEKSIQKTISTMVTDAIVAEKAAQSAKKPVQESAKKAEQSVKKPAQEKAVQGVKRPAENTTAPAPKKAATDADRAPLTKGEKKKLKKQRQKAALLTKEVVAYSRKLDNGVFAEVLKVGDGVLARPGKVVKIRFSGKVSGSTEVYDQGDLSFQLGMGHVIRGLDVGVRGMQKGEFRRLRVPANMAYGKDGVKNSVPPNSDVVIDVTLLDA